jgi:hypothetical protein
MQAMNERGKKYPKPKLNGPSKRTVQDVERNQRASPEGRTPFLCGLKALMFSVSEFGTQRGLRS